MARLKAFLQRTTETKPSNLGKVLLFCEGPTEVSYFEYFALIIRENNNKYSHMDIVPLPAGGDAQTVLNYAEDFLAIEQNIRTYSLYEKHLVFDCDAPPTIQSVITKMKASENQYYLLVTNLLFEVWLLMHFEELTQPLSNTKKKIYTRLSEALGREYSKKQEEMPGLVRQIIGNGDNLRSAISHAEKLEEQYKNRELNIITHISQMNPYTSVHKLMERILNLNFESL